jgi:SPP1 family predicted phage head-tail adaptor
MGAGKLRHSITIERKVSAPDGAGGVVLTWAAQFNLRAMVKPSAGTESQRHGRLEASTTHKIYLRYAAGLLASDRILFKGRYFNIRSILNIEERDLWLEISAQEGVAQ